MGSETLVETRAPAADIQSRPLRVGIDYTAAVNQSAGIGRIVRGWVGSLIQLDPSVEYLLLHATPNAGATFRLPISGNVTPRPLRLSERWLTILWHRLRAPVPVDWLTGPIDVFHSPDFVLPPVRQARSIVTVHDLAFLLYPECADEGLRSYLERVVPRSVSRAHFVVADSENTRNDVICLLGVPPERTAVVYGGVDPTFQQITDPGRLAPLRRRFGLDEETPFILFVGVIEPRKNLVGLMDAFAILKSRQSLPHKLLIAGGRGWLWEGIEEHAERSPVGGDIRFAGFVPDEDLPALYSAAQMFVFPSHYEGFGLPALEAMACGTPVISSRASSLPEVVGDAGLLVEPDDPEQLAAAMELLALNPNVREDLRRRGHERAAAFTWEAGASGLLDIYRRVAAS